jgi:hypothetical protein
MTAIYIILYIKILKDLLLYYTITSMSNIVYIENLTPFSSGKYDNLPIETDYIIISCLKNYIETPVLGNLPICLKKIIIIDYEKTITYWSGYKSLQEYMDVVTGGKIPFNCKIETITDEKEGYQEGVCYFCAIGDEEDEESRLFKLNKRIERGIYDLKYYDSENKEVIMDDFIRQDGKSIYINVGSY